MLQHLYLLPRILLPPPCSSFLGLSPFPSSSSFRPNVQKIVGHSPHHVVENKARLGPTALGHRRFVQWVQLCCHPVCYQLSACEAYIRLACTWQLDDADTLQDRLQADAAIPKRLVSPPVDKGQDGAMLEGKMSKETTARKAIVSRQKAGTCLTTARIGYSMNQHEPLVFPVSPSHFVHPSGPIYPIPAPTSIMLLLRLLHRRLLLPPSHQAPAGNLYDIGGMTGQSVGDTHSTHSRRGK